jgi:hypothetical protein
MHTDPRLFTRARRTQAGPPFPDGNLNAIASVQRGPYRGDMAITVLNEMTSFSAISALVRPKATAGAMTTSRAVRE